MTDRTALRRAIGHTSVARSVRTTAPVGTGPDSNRGYAMRRTRYLLAAVLLVGGAAAHGQAVPEGTKSAEQITCDLTGQCGEQAEAAEPAADDGAPAEGGRRARISAATRGAVFASPAKRDAYTGRQKLATPGQQGGGKGHHPVKPATTGKSSLTVGFALGSATLDSAGLAQAQALLAALQGPGLAGKHLIVAGHTDSIGGRDYNIDLSQRRATALVDYLASQGVPRSLLDPVGYGYDRPLPGLSASEPRNRRVEIVLADVARP